MRRWLAAGHRLSVALARSVLNAAANGADSSGPHREASMRISAFPIVVVLAVGSSAGFAQQLPDNGPGPAAGPGLAVPPPPLSAPPPIVTPPLGVAPPPAVPAPAAAGVAAPPGGRSPQNASSGQGSAGGDVTSTASVKAVPCSRSARETDGTTTCIGIPDRTSRHRRGY